MAWRGAVKSFVSSGTFLSMIGGIGASGAYVAYTDSTRYPRMTSTFAKGNILPPLAENDFEVAYARRPAMEERIREILTPTLSNEYFIVQGPVGVGKTRLIVELTRQMIDTRGAQNLGAPVYVLANQGRNFAETLGNAVNFYFDEHVSFRFFLDLVLRVHSMPRKDDDNRIVRVLDAIEKSSFDYLTKTGRPLVLIIDGLDDLARRSPSAVKMIQDKAKLWADTNSVKVVFVCNTEDTELLLQSNSSNWSRASSPIALRDLSKDETIQFLKSDSLMEKSKSGNVDQVSRNRKEGMSSELAEKVYDLVGGRIRHLIMLKRNWLVGHDYEDIAQDLMQREREKFVSVTNHSKAWKAIGLVRKFNFENISGVQDTKGIENKYDSATKASAAENLANRESVKGRLKIEKSLGGALTANDTTQNIVTDETRASTEGAASSTTSKGGTTEDNDVSLNVNNSNIAHTIYHEYHNDDEGNGYLLSKLMKKTSPEVVRGLVKAGLLRCERSRLGVIVKFESRLTENVVNDLEKAYRADVIGASED